MSDRSDSPSFDRSKYVRPNDKWVCGKISEGQVCRDGPDASGRCRARFECQPSVSGEGKDRKFKCTRPPELGGPCQGGPSATGTCSQPVTPCAPVRSIRSRRGLVTWTVLAATAGICFLLLGTRERFRFINPGPLSAKHSSADFSAILGVTNFNDRCEACHVSARRSPPVWVAHAIEAGRGDLAFGKLLSPAEKEMSSIDRACLGCHSGKRFHEPNVPRDLSCSTCHLEHQGAGPIKPVASVTCVSCHGNAEQMRIAAAKGRDMEPALFHRKTGVGLLVSAAPRPPEGFTKVIHSFSGDHPEFRIRSSGLSDTNTLKFNHQTHFSDRIPLVNGRKLDCAYCHIPDASGAFHQKIRFENQCAACHSLQLDAEHTELRLPHGNVEAARAFLHSLPTQYADYARKVRGIRNDAEVDSFVRTALSKLRERVRVGEDLERELFFADYRTAPVVVSGSLPASGRARFPGCAYCHEVKKSSDDRPVVTRPAIPDRWMEHSAFDHARHTMAECSECHRVTQSRLTSDILLPSRADCLRCHGPKGGVSESCLTCHSYHHEPFRAAK